MEACSHCKRLAIPSLPHHMQVLSPEVLERVARVLLTVRGSHCLTLSDTAVKGLFAACRNGSSAMKVLLHVLGALARTSVRQIADMQAPASCAAADAKVAEGYEPEASCGDIECHVASPGPQASSQPVEEGEATCPHQASDQADGSRSAASTPAQLHRECAVLAQYFACIGSLALCQTAFIEHRMDVAQRMAESMPSKKNKQSDHAMAGVFHCSDIVDDQEALQSELLAALKPASRSVLKFCSSKLLLRASTSLRQHACICIMRLANIDSDIAERSLPVMFHLLHHGNRYVRILVMLPVCCVCLLIQYAVLVLSLPRLWYLIERICTVQGTSGRGGCQGYIERACRFGVLQAIYNEGLHQISIWHTDAGPPPAYAPACNTDHNEACDEQRLAIQGRSW